MMGFMLNEFNPPAQQIGLLLPPTGYAKKQELSRESGRIYIYSDSRPEGVGKAACNMILVPRSKAGGGGMVRD
jgi:hypothetical protein